MTIRFNSTTSSHRELSNSYPFTPFSNHSTVFPGFDEGGLHFPSVEHYYQYMKLMSFNTPKARLYAQSVILPAKSALLAKRLGSKFYYFQWLYPKVDQSEERLEIYQTAIPEWEEKIEAWSLVRVSVMRRAIRLKFNHFMNPAITQFLINTFPEPLTEMDGRWDDERFWTEGGENMMGLLLMEWRNELVRS
jgi:predicted NAD-dependent protein-ADP-ribosyltransferase YbiA (DUF1768 family)